MSGLPSTFSIDSPYEWIVDENEDGTILYQGYCSPGSAKSAAVWKLRKITLVGTARTARWANSDIRFVHVWNDRTSLSYPNPA